MLWPNSKLETNFSLLSYLFRYLARTPSTPPPHRGMGLWATVKEPEPCIILIIANWISVGGEGGRGQRLMLASAQLADKYGICAHLVPSQTTKSWVLNFLLSKKPSLTPPPRPATKVLFNSSPTTFLWVLPFFIPHLQSKGRAAILKIFYIHI